MLYTGPAFSTLTYVDSRTAVEWRRVRSNQLLRAKDKQTETRGLSRGRLFGCGSDADFLQTLTVPSLTVKLLHLSRVSGV